MTGQTWDTEANYTSILKESIQNHLDAWHSDMRTYLMDSKPEVVTVKARVNVLWAFITNNRGGHKSEDVHGRKYRLVYRKFGNKLMAREFMKTNSWGIKYWHYGSGR